MKSNKNIISAIITIFFMLSCSNTDVKTEVIEQKNQPQVSESVVIKTGVSNNKTILAPKITVKNNVGSLSKVGWKAYRTSQANQLSDNFSGTKISILNLESESFIAIVIPTKIFFNGNTSEISKEFYSSIDYIVAVLSAYPESRVMVSGFTDDTGNPKANIDISQKRAQSAATYIVKRGLSPYRITAIGYGSSSYISNNSTSVGREQNRRIEIKILPPATY